MTTDNPVISEEALRKAGFFPKETRMDGTRHYFALHQSRYLFDGLLHQSDGWEQFDTDQDASYFGVWVNTRVRQVVSYCEGDLYVRDFDDKEAYRAELKRLDDFYGDVPPTFTVYTAGKRVEVVCPRPTGDPAIDDDPDRLTREEATKLVLS